MTRERSSVYTRSSSDEASSFHPNPIIPFSRAKENCHLGRQPTVNQRIRVSTSRFTMCCTASAQTPQPR